MRGISISQPHDGLAAYLTSLSLEWIVDGILGEDKVLLSRISDQTALNTLAEHLHRHTGMNTAFVCFFHGDFATGIPGATFVHGGNLTGRQKG